MTGFYEFFGMPDKINITCPSCRGRAIFRFAHILRLDRKADVSLFEKDYFEFRYFNERHAKKWPGILFFPKQLSGRNWQKKLPEKYQKQRTIPHMAKNACTDGTSLGLVSCHKCFSESKHTLDWPNDAYYAIEHKGNLLWAYDKEMMIEIKDYIQTTVRGNLFAIESIIIRHLPTVFKLVRNRDAIVKKINKLIAL